MDLPAPFGTEKPEYLAGVHFKIEPVEGGGAPFVDLPADFRCE